MILRLSLLKLKLGVLIVISVVSFFVLAMFFAQKDPLSYSVAIDVRWQNYTTIVAAYFQIDKSKYTPDEYDKWLQNMMLSVTTSPLVMFIDRTSFDKYNQLRRQVFQHDNRLNRDKTAFFVYESIWTLVEELQLERNRTYVHNYQHIQPDLDVEKSKHSPELYAIWNMKAYFTKKASDTNPFGSKFFMYVDAGSWRDGRSTADWPNASFVKEVADQVGDRIVFGQVGEATGSEYNDTIQGGFFAGTQTALAGFKDAYYALHDQKLDNNEFIGKDQTLMNILVFGVLKENEIKHRPLSNVSLILSLKGPSQCGERWFFFRYYFASYSNSNHHSCQIADKHEYLRKIQLKLSLTDFIHK